MKPVQAGNSLLLHVASAEETFIDVHKRSYMQQAEVDFGDTVLGDQPGLNSEMQQLQAFQNRFNLSSTEAQPLLKWLHFIKGVVDTDVLLFRMPLRDTFVIFAHS